MILLTLAVAELVLLLVLGVTFVFLGLPLIFNGAPFIPSYRQKKRALLEPLFKIAQIAPGRKFIDLGSGDGRVVIEFAAHGYESYGVELNPFLVWWSRLKIQKSPLRQGSEGQAKLKSPAGGEARQRRQNAKIIRTNFWNFDLSQFDVVYIFQLNSVNVLLADKLKKELKPGAIIISASFILPGFDLLKKEGSFWVYRN